MICLCTIPHHSGVMDAALSLKFANGFCVDVGEDRINRTPKRDYQKTTNSAERRRTTRVQRAQGECSPNWKLGITCQLDEE